MKIKLSIIILQLFAYSFVFGQSSSQHALDPYNPEYNSGVIIVKFKETTEFSKLKSIWAKAIIGGGLLGILLYFMPPLYSEGYDAIRLIVSGNAESLLDHTFADGSNFIQL